MTRDALLAALDARARRVDALRDTVTCADALALLRSLPAACVDLFVTSPPYNLLNSTGNGLKSTGGLWTSNAFLGGYAEYSDNMPHEDYVRWQRAILSEMMRVLTDDGAIFYNHKWRVQNGHLQDRADITAGFPVRQIIIWNRGHGFNFNDTYFVPFYEVIYLIAKPEFKLSEGANRYSDVWNISPEQKKDHPNAFPFELPYRCISSTNARLICDPFCGRGTTLDAARQLGRHYIGGDISAEYVALARDRLAQPWQLPLLAAAEGAGQGGESSGDGHENHHEQIPFAFANEGGTI